MGGLSDLFNVGSGASGGFDLGDIAKMAKDLARGVRVTERAQKQNDAGHKGAATRTISGEIKRSGVLEDRAISKLHGILFRARRRISCRRTSTCLI